MANDKAKAEQTISCGCPLCDNPVCPDSTDERYRCSSEGRLAIHQVDCTGLYCPVPVMRAREEIDLLEKGNLMELVADDPASAEDIPRWARRAGHNLVNVRRQGDDYHFLIQKGSEVL